jgi:hypothetical protein
MSENMRKEYIYKITEYLSLKEKEKNGKCVVYYAEALYKRNQKSMWWVKVLCGDKSVRNKEMAILTSSKYRDIEEIGYKDDFPEYYV